MRGGFLDHSTLKIQLLRHEERFRLLVGAVKDYAIFLLDPSGHVMTWNEGAERIYGYKPEEIIGRHFSSFYPPDVVRSGRIDTVLKTALQSGHHEEEGWRIRNDKTLFWANAVLSAVFDDRHNHIGFAKVTRDLTDKRRIEQELLQSRAELERRVQEKTTALAQSEEKYRKMIDAADQGVLVGDTQDRAVFVNQKMAELLGYRPDEIIGRPFQNLVPPDLTPQLRENIRQRHQGVKGHGEFQLLRKDGTTFWVRYTSNPLFGAGGEYQGLVSMMADVSEEKERELTERFLAEATLELSSSLDVEKTLNAVARLAVPRLADWCILDLLENGAFHRIAVIHSDPAMAKLAHEFEKRVPDLSAAGGASRAIRTRQSVLYTKSSPPELLMIGTNEPEQVEMVRKLGIQSYVAVAMEARGRVVGGITLLSVRPDRQYSVRDLHVTEELARRAAIAVDNALLYKLAQQAIRARDDVLATVSHDLKNPLTSISLNAALLSKTAPSGAHGKMARQQSERILRSTVRAQALIRDLLDVTRIETGGIQLDLNLDDARILIREAVELAHPLADEKSIRLKTALGTGALPVFCDHNRVLQVLSNLLGNAIKFTPRGGVITIGEELKKAEVVLSVSDSGPGIRAKDLPHIFERFWRGAKADKSGSGLGLAIAKGLVEAHSGRIWAESPPGKGARVFFTLPRAPRKR